MSIKKPYVSLVDFLELNRDKKVSTILDEIKLMCESKKVESTVIKIDDKVVAIFCYYHKQWEIIADVPYGSKVGTKSGLNTMCKVGTSIWSKKQREAKKSLGLLLTDVASGKIQPSDLPGLQVDIETERTTMDLTEIPLGYFTEEELLQKL